MRVCPACGRHNADDTDFCECGEYLDWTPAPGSPAAPVVAGRPIADRRPADTAPAPADSTPAIEQTVVSRPPPRRPIDETVISRPAAQRPTAATGRPRPVDRPPAAAPASSPAPAPAPGEPRPPAVESRPTAASGATVVAPPRATRRGPAAEPPRAEPPRAEPRRADPAPTVLLSVYRARSERSAGAWPATTVAAGGRAVVFALIRNQSGIVDNYDLTVDGLPDGWWTVNPPTVYLVPLGRGEGYEQEVEVALHPPRSPEAEARAWTIHLIATSRSSGQQVAAAGATVTIEPYHELDAAVGPPLADGRLGARYQAVVVNLANAPAEVAISLVDDEQNLDFEPDGRVVTFRAVRAAMLPFSGLLRKQAGKLAGGVRPPSLGAGPGSPLPREAQRLVGTTVGDERKRAAEKADTAFANITGEHAKAAGFGQPVRRILPGDSASVPFVVRPREQLWIGRRVNRRFALEAHEVGDAARALPRSAVFRQRPWLPWWITLVVTLIIIAILLLLLLKPKTVAVPDLTRAPSMFAAEQTLQRAGLVLSPDVQTRVDPQAPRGSIIDQTPKAGTRVRRGVTVSVLVATSHTPSIVPNVIGKTLAEADKKLGAAGFTLGSALPKPDPNQIIATQIPASGLHRKRGTPVNVFLKPRPRKAKKKAAGAAAAAAAAAGAAAAMVKVPAFLGAPRAAYEQKLTKAGLLAQLTYRIDPAKRDTVVGAIPVPGTKVKARTSVQVFLSAGPPRLAYDTGASLAAVPVPAAAAGGSASVQLVPGPATEPAWDPAGVWLAFVRGGSILAARPGQPGGSPVTLASTGAGISYDHPAFAPSHKTELVASIRHASDGDALCFSTLATATGPIALSCAPVPGWKLGAIAWGRRGYSLFVSAAAEGDSTRFGLLQFYASTRFSTQAADWQSSPDLVTPTAPGRGVLEAAVAPDGKSLAAIANLGDGRFHVTLTSLTDLALKSATTLPVLGCSVAWRSDGGELAVVQSDPQCTAPVGPIVGLAPRAPRVLTTIVLAGANPDWEPIKLGPVR